MLLSWVFVDVQYISDDSMGLGWGAGCALEGIYDVGLKKSVSLPFLP